MLRIALNLRNLAVAGLVLASSSPYRRELLARLGLPFDVEIPNVDESPLPEEAPLDLVVRLSAAKAKAVAARRSNAIVIGSDQIAALATEPSPIILGKPGDRSAAINQLRAQSGRRVDFITGLCVIDSSSEAVVEVETTQVQFRKLSDSEIANYVDMEQPFGCAGSIRSERLGITLVESISNVDPTTLMGLPLIRLTRLLRKAGLNPLDGTSRQGTR